MNTVAEDLPLASDGCEDSIKTPLELAQILCGIQREISDLSEHFSLQVQVKGDKCQAIPRWKDTHLNIEQVKCLNLTLQWNDVNATSLTATNLPIKATLRFTYQGQNEIIETQICEKKDQESAAIILRQQRSERIVSTEKEAGALLPTTPNWSETSTNATRSPVPVPPQGAGTLLPTTPNWSAISTNAIISPIPVPPAPAPAVEFALEDLEMALSDPFVPVEEDPREDEEAQGEQPVPKFAGCEWKVYKGGEQISLNDLKSAGFDYKLTNEDDIDCMVNSDKNYDCTHEIDEKNYSVTLTLSKGEKEKSSTCEIPSQQKILQEQNPSEGRLPVTPIRPPQLIRYNFRGGPILSPGVW